VRYEIRPLGPWVDAVTADRKGAGRFRAQWSDMLDLLRYEAEMLGASLLVLQVQADPDDIRRDGMLRARARVGFPGVKVSLDSRHGPLTYATDAYDHWQANVRAVALSMQALRAVDRYGVSTRGEQYRGWAAIESGGDRQRRDAQDLIASYGGLTEARMATHPDRGGSAEAFIAVQAAAELLGLS
jgi:hypothetical protein